VQVNLKIPDKLLPFYTKKKRYKIAYGGRGGAKSMTIANLLAMFGYYGDLVGCFREFQSSLDDSVYSLLDSQIKALNIPGYNFKKNQIDHSNGGGFRFRGLARSIEGIKSMHGFKKFWLEEGQFISGDSLKILTPTLREENSELWVSANPMNSADPFSQRFIVPFLKELERDGFYEDDLHYIVKINWRDNPWFPEVLEQERQNDLQLLSKAMYEHVWEGAFNDSVEDSIISAEWFDAAIDAHIKLGFKPNGPRIISHDPSDLGTDDKGLVDRHGCVILEACSRDFGDVNEGMDWALDYAIENRADLFVWDCDGIGLGLKRQVKDALKGKKVDFHMFHGGGKCDNPMSIYNPITNLGGGIGKKQKTNNETFRNKRAQKYWSLRDRFFNTWLAVEKGKYINPDELISISSGIQDMRMLRSEVCRIPRVYNGLGKIQIMTKKEMKKLKILSPNLADSAMMSEVTPRSVHENAQPMKFDSFFD
jgi:phage terminase large subunit